MKYISTLQASFQAGLSQDRIRALVVNGKIHGAVKVGKAWLIPNDFSITRSGTRGPKSTKTGANPNPPPTAPEPPITPAQ